MEIVMSKEYWIVRVEWSQTDTEYSLVSVDDAKTASDAEAYIRNKGCNARYITAQRSKGKVVE
jgi:hypothetical protein